MTDQHLCFVDSIRTWGGAEVWVLDTARQLVAQGHRCSIVAQPGSALFLRAREAGVPCAGIPIRFDAAPWTLAKLYRYFKQQKVTAIVANLTKDLKAASVAGKMTGVEVILASRESDFPLKNKLYYKWYFNEMASGVLVNSQATRKTVLKSAPWLDESRVHLLYKGIDTERFQPAPERPSLPPTVGFVGQLIERKGLFDLMAAWEIVERNDWDVAPRLLLAGEGKLEQIISDWRDHLEFPDHVELLGFQENIEIFYGKISVLVMPSLSEGFGLAAAEASACGVPVVATKTSSLPEIVLDGVTGILVPPENHNSLSKAMIQLLKDKETTASLGSDARSRIINNFSLQKTLNQLLALTKAQGSGQ